MQNNMYDTNIANSRNINDMNTNMSLNQNPYVNQENINPNENPKQVAENNNQGLYGGLNTGDFVKGALLGAALTYLLTNKGAQQNIMKAVSKGSELFQAGMEEMKEKFEDAKAEMEARQQ